MILKKLFRIQTTFKLILLAFFVISMLLFVSSSNPKFSQAATSITDQNGDGVINLVDARILAPPATTSCQVCADVTGNKIINQKDIALIKFHAGLGDPSEGSDYSYDPRLDVDNDGTLSQEDADIVQNYLGQTVQSGAFGLDDPSELMFGFETKDLIIQFKKDATETQKQALLAKYNMSSKYKYKFLNQEFIETQENNVEDLQKILRIEPIVDKVDKNHIAIATTDDPEWDNQWGPKKIRIEETWYTEHEVNEGTSVKVAVIDSGVDSSHFDLQGKVASGVNVTVDVFDPARDDTSDTGGHGTEMAGIIAATANNNQGITGLGWNIKIVPVKACIPFQTLSTCPETYVSRALEWILSEVLNGNKIQVVNMSFNTNHSSSIDSWLDELSAQHVTLIASSGNFGDDSPVYPASHSKVLAIGASKSDDGVWSLSNGGADFIAPGVDIITTKPVSLDGDGDGLAYVNGTSPAAAHASGIAALCSAVDPSNYRWATRCGNFSYQGYGRIDAWATVWYHKCSRFNFNHIGSVDSADRQQIAFRINDPLLYNISYDIFPVGTDGKIDFGDLYLESLWSGLNC